MSCAIVIVTHNRLSMLCVCLKAALAQGADSVFVVDNASGDGTGSYLKKMAAMHACLKVLPQAENLGSSGGFAAGIAAACGAGHEWLWLMDDDVEPLPGALAALLARAKKLGPCCLVPAKLCSDGRTFDYEYLISRKTLRRRRVSSLGRLAPDALVPANSGNFEGLLTHRDVVNRVGLPERDFFICWDDAFFGMKAAERFPNYYLNRFCLKKQVDKEKLVIGGKAWLGSSLISRRYFLRNYRAVMRYLRVRGELSSLAYWQYAWEVAKALGITMFVERNPKGMLGLLASLTCRGKTFIIRILAAWAGQYSL